MSTEIYSAGFEFQFTGPTDWISERLGDFLWGGEDDAIPRLKEVPTAELLAEVESFLAELPEAIKEHEKEIKWAEEAIKKVHRDKVALEKLKASILAGEWRADGFGGEWELACFDRLNRRSRLAGARIFAFVSCRKAKSQAQAAKNGTERAILRVSYMTSTIKVGSSYPPPARNSFIMWQA
jgi:hypothetical protein